MGDQRQRVRKWPWCAGALGVVALAVVVWRVSSGASGIPMAETVLMVDVRSGQFFEMTVGRNGLMVPERHPQTGELGLFPVEQNANGDWVIPARMREGLEMVESGGQGVVDRRTGVVKSNGAAVQQSRPRAAE